MKVYLVAGEPSGDKLGAELMAGLKSCAPYEVDFCGVGGFLMPTTRVAGHNLD